MVLPPNTADNETKSRVAQDFKDASYKLEQAEAEMKYPERESHATARKGRA